MIGKLILQRACPLIDCRVQILLRQHCRGQAVFLSHASYHQIVKIFSGSSNRPLATAIAASIGTELGKSTIDAFPDGETFVKIEENVRGEDVFLVQSTSPPTNQNLMEMFIVMDALRRAS